MVSSTSTSGGALRYWCSVGYSREEIEMKKLNKIVKAIRGAKLDICESKYVSGRALKRDGKKTSNRAIRRMSKVLIAESA